MKFHLLIETNTPKMDRKITLRYQDGLDNQLKNHLILERTQDAQQQLFQQQKRPRDEENINNTHQIK